MKRRTPLHMINLGPRALPDPTRAPSWFWRVVDFALDAFLLASLSFLAGWHLFNRLF